MKRRLLHLLLILSLVLQGTYFAPATFASADSNGKTYLVGLKKETNADSFIEKKELKEKNPKKIKNINTLVLPLDESELQSLQTDDEVAFIEEDSSVQIAVYGDINQTHKTVEKMKKDSDTVPWGIHDIGAEQAIENKIDGKTVNIAVLDTGIANHPDLKVAGGVSFVDGTVDYVDDNGHGTHVAGTIAALNNKIGVIGAAPKSNIYAVKVLDQKGSGSYSQVIQGIDWAIENKTDIISMSFGGVAKSEALHEAVKAATDHGILVIAAAGNNGAGEETELYPALYSEVISVGAVNQSYKRASFSSTGSELDLVAPGVDILSTTKDGNYGVLSGTSMATPHVTGAAAVLWSQNKNSTNLDIKNKLIETATILGDNHEYGNGLINLAKALGIVDGPIVSLEPISPEPQQPEESTNPTEPVTPPTEENFSFDIKEIDAELLGLSKKLMSLKDRAIQEENVTLAKKIEQSYNDLLSKNIQLHQLPEQLNKVSKEEVSSKVHQAEVNNFYAANQDAFKELENKYHQSIQELSSQFPIQENVLNEQSDSQPLQVENTPNASQQGDVQTSAYDYVGDGQTITAGSSATVSLKLYEPKSQIDIAVLNSSNTVITSAVRYNVSAGVAVSYTWSTSSSTAAGTYKIRYRYTGTTAADDFFTIYVNAPTSGSDTYEPNDSTSSAKTVYPGSSYTSYISSSTDVDYYKFTAGATGTINVRMSVPSTKDYDFKVTNSTGTTIASGTAGTGTTENETFSVSANSTYYIKVYGYSGAYSSSSYTLTLGSIVPEAQALYLDSPVDVSLSSGQYKVFRFTPSSSGSYKFFTSQYGGYGGSNDTYLELYSDSSLTNRIAYDDDSGEGTFSELKYNLTSGTTYYLKLRHYSSTGSVYARLTVTRDIQITTIYLDSPVDASVVQNEYKVYRFTPSASGKYKFYTGPYGGTGGSSDTYLHLYSDQNLTNQLASNDDSNGTLFSEIQYDLTAGTSYYIKFRGYNDGSASARLTVNNIYKLLDVYVQTTDDTTPTYNGNFAREYPNGVTYVQIDPGEEVLSELDPALYFVENNQYWIEINKLSNYMDAYKTVDSKIMLISESLPQGEFTDNFEEIRIIEPTGEVSGSSVSTTNFNWIRSFTVFTYVSWADTNNIYYKITPRFTLGSKPTSRRYQHVVETANYLSGPYTVSSTKDEYNSKSSTISVPITKTSYWKWKVTVTSTYSFGITTKNYNISPILLNKVGQIYPEYEDPQSGIKLWLPPANLAENPQARSSDYRTKFIQYYESNWGLPTHFVWDDVEIHHMRPLQYGGTNDVSNLIPLLKQDRYNSDIIKHRTLTDWWYNY